MNTATDISEIVEDLYLSRFGRSSLALRYQQLQYAFEYGLTRLEAQLLDYYFDNVFEMGDIVVLMMNDNTDVGKKIFEKVKFMVFDKVNEGYRAMLSHFTSEMSEEQFDIVKEDVENLIINSLQIDQDNEIMYNLRFSIKDEQMRKLDKVKAFVNDKFIKMFPNSEWQIRIFMLDLDNFMKFVIDYFITDFPLSHQWQIVQTAIEYDLEPLKDFLSEYLRDNYANLSDDVQDQLMEQNQVDDFVMDATLQEN